MTETNKQQGQSQSSPGASGEGAPAATTHYLDWAVRGRAAGWRYAVGFVLTTVIFFIISGLGALPITYLWPDFQDSVVLSLFANLSSFLLAFLLIPITVWVLHRRPPWSVAAGKRGFEGWNFFVGFGVGMAVHAVGSLLAHLTGTIPLQANPDFNLVVFLPVLVLAFFGIFIQAGSEEMLFRGYYTQMVRRYTGNPVFFLLIPAILFALPHVSNVEQFHGSLWAMTPYLAMGLLFGWAAWRSGSLWMALGLHLANNYTAVVLVGTRGDVLPSVAPLTIEIPGLFEVSAVIIGQALVTVAVIEWLLRKRAA